MTARWRSLAIHCRERGWSKARAIYELQNGLPYRFVPPLPPGCSVVWSDFNVTHGFNVETGDLTLATGVFGLVEGGGSPPYGIDSVTVRIEVDAAPASHAEEPSPPAYAPAVSAPAASPAPTRKVSEADVRDAVRAIVDEHPPGIPPLDEESFLGAVEGRLGVPVSRERILAARD